MPLFSARKETTPRLPGCVRLRQLFANGYKLHFSRPSAKPSSKRLRLQEQRSTRRALPGSGMQERCSHRTKRLTMLCLKWARSSEYAWNRKHNIACYRQGPSQSTEKPKCEPLMLDISRCFMLLFAIANISIANNCYTNFFPVVTDALERTRAMRPDENLG